MAKLARRTRDPAQAGKILTTYFDSQANLSRTTTRELKKLLANSFAAKGRRPPLQHLEAVNLLHEMLVIGSRASACRVTGASRKGGDEETEDDPSPGHHAQDTAASGSENGDRLRPVSLDDH